MLEKDFENVLHRYPELLEEGLKFSGRQVNVGGKFVDLLFEDRFGQKLVIELKKGIIKREHIAQLLDYEGHFLTDDNPNIRVMLVGNRVPPNLRNSLDHHGFEWKEIKVSELIAYLKNKNDIEMLAQFVEEAQTTSATITVSSNRPKSNNVIKVQNSIDNTKKEFWTKLLQNMNNKGSLYQNINPWNKGYLNAGSGLSGIPFHFYISKTFCRTGIYIERKPEGESMFVLNELNNKKSEIERSFGDKLNWEKLDSGKACRITFVMRINLHEKANWDEIINTMTDSMIRMERSFKVPLQEIKGKLVKRRNNIQP